MRWWDSITDSKSHEFEQAGRVGDGQGRVVCSTSWGHKGLDTTERMD